MSQCVLGLSLRIVFYAWEIALYSNLEKHTYLHVVLFMFGSRVLVCFACERVGMLAAASRSILFSTIALSQPSLRRLQTCQHEVCTFTPTKSICGIMIVVRPTPIEIYRCVYVGYIIGMCIEHPDLYISYNPGQYHQTPERTLTCWFRK